MPAAMADERTVTAMERIEQALVRIEAASRQATPAPADDAEARRLREAHDALRDKVRAAIGEIDRLLATGSQS